MNKLVHSCAFLLLPFLLIAQAEDIEEENQNRAYWQVGYDANFAKFDPLSPSSILPDLYPDLEQVVHNISLVFGSRMDRFDAHFEFYGGQNEVASNDFNNTSRYRHFGVGLGIGFNVLNSDRGWFFGPEITTNFLLAQAVFADRREVGSILDAPTVEYFKLNQFAIPIDLGLQFSKQIFDRKEPTRYWLIGLRGGYRLHSQGGWELDMALPINFFPASTQGFFLGVRIGRGGR